MTVGGRIEGAGIKGGNAHGGGSQVILTATCGRATCDVGIWRLRAIGFVAQNPSMRNQASDSHLNAGASRLHDEALWRRMSGVWRAGEIAC
jgi:hypothetical protein